MEVVRDIAAGLARVREGTEIIIEHDARPIAIIKPPPPTGRLISEVIADLEARGTNAAMDEDFAQDIEAGVDAYRKPWNPPSWD